MKKSTKAIATIFILFGMSWYVLKSRQREVKFETVVRVKHPERKFKIGEPVDLEVGLKNISNSGVGHTQYGGVYDNFRFNIYSKSTGRQVEWSEEGKYSLNLNKNKTEDMRLGGVGVTALEPQQEYLFEIDIAPDFIFMPQETYSITVEAIDQGRNLANPSPEVEISFQ